MEVGVSFVAILAREHLALLGHPDRTGKSTLGKCPEEPAGGTGSASDGAAPSVEELGDHSFLVAGFGHRFLAFEDAPLRGENTGVFVGVGIAHHGGLHSGRVWPHDGEVFGKDDMGSGEVVAGFKKRTDGQAGAPQTVGMTLGKTGFTGENLDEQDIGNGARHADDQLAQTA